MARINGMIPYNYEGEPYREVKKGRGERRRGEE